MTATFLNFKNGKIHSYHISYWFSDVINEAQLFSTSISYSQIFRVVIIS